ncbi:MAG: hypothetical protein CM1200mP18_04160 [Gammaproteobacteria bacterium]|nr:MAG: hypothetical protein CM1200mP18_04160 [Gammaproteobacteria bacterium]
MIAPRSDDRCTDANIYGVPLAQDAEALNGAEVAIIGAPYVAGAPGKYAGVDKSEWVLAPQRVRQQSARYPTGYIQELDVDIFEQMRVVDMGDADISPEVNLNPTAENILKGTKFGRETGQPGSGCWCRTRSHRSKLTLQQLSQLPSRLRSAVPESRHD